MESLGRGVWILGILLVALGLWLQFGPPFSSLPPLRWLGRLPGDFRIERPGFRLYFPLMSCLLLSAVLSALLWLWGRMR